MSDPLHETPRVSETRDPRVPRTRFVTPSATPPQGFYEYALDGERVTGRSVYEICLNVRTLRARRGLATAGDGFALVMEYMCPRLPDGFCTKPSTVRLTGMAEVKAKTSPLFAKPLATSDTVEARLRVCSACGRNVLAGYCSDCTGLHDWVRRGFGGARGRYPQDAVVGLCSATGILVAALVSVDRPGVSTGVHGCWSAEKEPGNGC